MIIAGDLSPCDHTGGRVIYEKNDGNGLHAGRERLHGGAGGGCRQRRHPPHRNIHRYARAEDRPGHTIFAIATAGMENAGRRYTGDEVKDMARHQKDRCGGEAFAAGFMEKRGLPLTMRRRAIIISAVREPMLFIGRVFYEGTTRHAPEGQVSEGRNRQCRAEHRPQKGDRRGCRTGVAAKLRVSPGRSLPGSMR